MVLLVTFVCATLAANLPAFVATPDINCRKFNAVRSEVNKDLTNELNKLSVCERTSLFLSLPE